ncbi:MAG: hypothetical protein NZZ41_00660 [Candidatus Dojkabacteria bacterium]|nr:hypothetical protein [Candidatus Dojkabacteria bacterium]
MQESMFSEKIVEKIENEIYSFKLVSGEEIIGRVLNVFPDHFLIKKPLVLSLVQIPGSSGQAGVVFLPFMISSDDNIQVKLFKSSIVCMCKPSKEAESGYLKNTSGIEIPNMNLDLSALKRKM